MLASYHNIFIDFTGGLYKIMVYGTSCVSTRAEWYLMLFVQEKLSQHRNDLSKPAFLQTASKQVKLTN